MSSAKKDVVVAIMSYTFVVELLLYTLAFSRVTLLLDGTNIY